MKKFMVLLLVVAFSAIAIAQEVIPADSAVEQLGNAVEQVADRVEAAADAVIEAAEECDAAQDVVVVEGEFSYNMKGTWWALLPPLIAILLALLTKEVYSSLFIGIICGALFVNDFKFLGTMDTIINDGLIAAVSSGAGIFIFLVILGVMVALINRTGATAAFGNWAREHVKTKTGASLMTFLLGILIFIDDYFNCLTVGSVMLPVTDAKKISRAKLAYLIDATAAPICMIAPISSWAAAVSDFAKDIPNYNGFDLFIKAIPFNFYSLLTLIFIVVISILNVDYGPMAIHEKNAREKGDLFTSGREVDSGVRPMENAKGKFVDLLLPVFTLIVVCVFALLYVGGYYSCEETVTFIDAFGNTDATVALPWGGVIVLVLTLFWLLARRVINFKEAMKCVPDGFNAMVPAILILTFAYTLKNMTDALEAKQFIASVMESSAANLKMFLPAVIFLVACGLSFSTGTSWGTFGILIPIVLGIFPADDQLLYIGMSACLAGAVCGDHCSPISDTSIMSSAGARCEHINHVATQLPYAISVAVFSFIGFLLSGFVQNWFVVFPIITVLMIVFLVIVKATKVTKFSKND